MIGEDIAIAALCHICSGSRIPDCCIGAVEPAEGIGERRARIDKPATVRNRKRVAARIVDEIAARGERDCRSCSCGAEHRAGGERDIRTSICCDMNGTTRRNRAQRKRLRIAEAQIANAARRRKRSHEIGAVQIDTAPAADAHRIGGNHAAAAQRRACGGGDGSSRAFPVPGARHNQRAALRTRRATIGVGPRKGQRAGAIRNHRTSAGNGARNCARRHWREAHVAVAGNARSARNRLPRNADRHGACGGGNRVCERHGAVAGDG